MIYYHLGWLNHRNDDGISPEQMFTESGIWKNICTWSDLEIIRQHGFELSFTTSLIMPNVKKRKSSFDALTKRILSSIPFSLREHKLQHQKKRWAYLGVRTIIKHSLIRSGFEYPRVAANDVRSKFFKITSRKFCREAETFPVYEHRELMH